MEQTQNQIPELPLTALTCLNGLIAEPYQWVFEGLDRAAHIFDCDLPNPGLRVPLTFEKWQQLANQEALLGEAQFQTYRAAS